jgi:hypothetical protein
MRPTAKETNAWITTLLLLVIYGGYIADANGALSSSAVLSLYFRSAVYLVIGLIVAVAAARLFQRPECEDERDRLIGLRAQRNAYFVAMSGLFLIFMALAFGWLIPLMWPGMKPTAGVMHVLVLTMVAAELTNQVSRIVDYRRLA